MRPVTFNCAVFQVLPRQTVHTSSKFPMLLPATTITTSWSIQVKLALINLLREYSPCWCNISELATAMIPPTGVRDSGRAIVVDIVSFIAGMRLQQQYARKSAVWLAGGRGMSSRRGKTTRR